MELKNRRILFLLGREPAARVAANTYQARLQGDFELKFVEERVLTWRRFLAFSRRRLKSRGPVSLLGAYGCYLWKMLFPEKQPARRYRPEFTTPDISRDPALARLLEEFRPGLIVIGFCGLLTRDFLERAGAPVVNTHPGLNPRYRGFGNIRAFGEGNWGQTGYTIHLVDHGVDSGRPLAAGFPDWSAIPFQEHESRTAALAAHHLADLLTGARPPQPPENLPNMESKVYGLPTLTQYLQARRKYRRRWGG